MSGRNWKLIHHTRGFCRLWQDQESGRFSLSDDSGSTPEDTDDHVMHGILWIDESKPLYANDFFDDTPMFMVRLTAEREPHKIGEYSASLDMTACQVLSVLTGQPLVIECRGQAYEITPMRSREPRPLNQMAIEARDVQDACNIAGVAGLLQRTHASLTRRLGSTYAASVHPITRAIVDKIVDLTQMASRIDREDWDEVERLAAGRLTALEAMGESVARKGT